MKEDVMWPIGIGVIGLGFVGRATASWFMSQGWKRGENLFLYDANITLGFQDDVRRARVIFVCVPSPSCRDGRCDTSIVESVVAQFRDSDKVVVIKSTVEPGTTDRLCEKYHIVTLFNPEFLTEANAQHDFLHPDRQIVGFTPNHRFYARVVLSILPQAVWQSPAGENHITAFEAELVKYFANMFGASKVSFANAMNIVAEATRADYNRIRDAVTADRRIGGAWTDVNHGSYRGFGGYCFPKDSRALISWINYLYEAERAAGREAKLLKAARNLLYASYEFNEMLLASQGLSVDDVSGHINKEIPKKGDK